MVINFVADFARLRRQTLGTGGSLRTTTEEKKQRPTILPLKTAKDDLVLEEKQEKKEKRYSYTSFISLSHHFFAEDLGLILFDEKRRRKKRLDSNYRLIRAATILVLRARYRTNQTNVLLI